MEFGVDRYCEFCMVKYNNERRKKGREEGGWLGKREREKKSMYLLKIKLKILSNKILIWISLYCN